MSDPAPAPSPSPAPSPAPAPSPTLAPAPSPGAAALAVAPATNWRDGLSEDLRGEAAWANYGSLDEFARGHLETKRLASSRVPTPGDTPETQAAFFDAVRPSDPKAYEISVPEGMPTEHAEAFRAKAHELALLPSQAKALADWNNEAIAAALTAQGKASQADVDKFKSEFSGNFAEKLAGVQAMLPKLGVQLEAEDLAALDSKIGSANLLRFMFAIHDQIGDLDFAGMGDQGGTQIHGMSPAQASATLKEKRADANWRQKAMQDGSAEFKEHQRLTSIITQGRMRDSQRPQQRS